MKRFPLFLIAGAAAVAVVSPFAPNLFANNQTAVSSPKWVAPQSEYPLGRKVVITVDPLGQPTKVYAGNANVVTGFDAPNAVRGTLLEEREHWLILQDGRYEKWIPKSKILLMNFCE